MSLLQLPPQPQAGILLPNCYDNKSNEQGTVSTQDPTTLLIIQAASYNNLSACSKFCLNSCRDVSGTITEQNCGPDIQIQDWQQYRGLAYELDCITPSCICLGGAFNISYGTLYEASLKFCNTLPTTKNLDSPEYDRLQGVLADYCVNNGMSPYGWINIIQGDSDNSKLLNPG